MRNRHVQHSGLVIGNEGLRPHLTTAAKFCILLLSNTIVLISPKHFVQTELGERLCWLNFHMQYHTQLSISSC